MASTMSNVNNIKDWLDRQQAMIHKNDIIPATAFLELVSHTEADGNVVLIPANQRYHVVEALELNTISVDNGISVPTSFATAGQMVQFRVQRSSFGLVKGINVVLTLTETGTSNPVQTAPLPFLFQRIEYWANGANGVKIQTLYPETMFFDSLAFYSNEQHRRFFSYYNYFNDNGFGQQFIPASGTVKWVMPIWGDWISQTKGVYMPALNEDIWVKLYLATSPVSGVTFPGKTAAGTLGISNIQLQIEQQNITTSDHKDLLNQYRFNKLEKNFLDTVVATNLSAAITAGSAFRWQLSGITGWVPYFFVLLRATAQPQYGTNHQITSSSKHISDSVYAAYSIGDSRNGAQISIENGATQILSGTLPFPTDYLQSVWSGRNIPGRFTDMFSGWYSFAFGDITAAEDDGFRKGAAWFSSQEYINITPQSSPTVETGELYTWLPLKITTFTTATAAVSGTWQLSWDGRTSNVLAYNAAAGLVQSELYALFAKSVGFNGSPIIALVDGTACNFAQSAGVAITIWNCPFEGLLSKTGKPLQLVAQGLYDTVGPFYLTPSLTLSQAANDAQGGTATAGGAVQKGLSTGTYQLDVIARIHTHLEIVPAEGGSKFEVKGYTS
jgi:hypothetical protein